MKNFFSFSLPLILSGTLAHTQTSDRASFDLLRLRDPATETIPAHIRNSELKYASTLPGYSSPLSCFRRGAGGEVVERSSTPWPSRGPYALGGRTRALAIDISSPSKLLAGSASGGMWISSNNGTSWNPAWTDIHQSISCIAQDTRTGKTNTWYIGTGEGIGQSAGGGGANSYYTGNGMYKSTDGGLTWNLLASTSSSTPQSFDSPWDIVWNVAVNPADTVADIIYAATYNGIYKSANGGSSWTLVKGTGLGIPSSYFSDVAISNQGTVYAALSSGGDTSQTGIWRSADGVNWKRITPVNFSTTFGRIKIGIAPSDENQVYFLAAGTTGFGMPDTNASGAVEWNSLWKYDHDTSGGKWFDLSSYLPGTGGLFDRLDLQGGNNMVIKVSPVDTSSVFLGGTNLYRSTDGFFSDTNTTQIGGYQPGASLPVLNFYPNHHPGQQEIIFSPPNPAVVYSANGGGIYKTGNALATTVAWTPLNSGYMTSMFNSVAMDHLGMNDSILIGGAQDNGSWFVNSGDPQAAWATPYGEHGSYCAISDNKAYYYFSMQNGKMIKAQLNSSGTVQAFTRMDPTGGTGYQFINPFVIDPNDNRFMYLAGGKNLWRNDNLTVINLNGSWNTTGAAWNMFPDTVPTPGATITALGISKNPLNILYYGTSSRRLYRVNDASTGTPSAVDITGSAFPPGYISCVAVDPTDAKKVMVAFSNYGVYSIFYTANADSTAPTWIKVAGNLEENSNTGGTGSGPSVRWVSMMPVADGMVYLAATSTGLYATDTLMGTGTLWAQQGAATIGNSICDMIDFRTTDGLVAVATHSHGIFSAKITSKNDVVAIKKTSPNQLQLGSFPNPFNSSAVLYFSLPEAGQVKLELYDVNGRSVRALADKQFPAGDGKVEFSSEGLAPGVYHCLMRSERGIAAEKMILIK